MSKFAKRRLIVGAGAALLLAAAAATWPLARVPTVTLAGVHPSHGSVRNVIVAKGTVNFARQIGIAASVNGYLSALHVGEGSKVARGAVLATIADPRTEQDLRIKRAELDHLDIKLGAALDELRVTRELHAAGGVSSHEVGQRELESRLLKEEARRLRLELQRLEQANALYRVSAPEPGTVTAVKVLRGQWIGPGQELFSFSGGGGGGAAIFAQVDPLDLERISVGQRVYFSADESNRERRGGRVAEVGKVVAGSSQSSGVKILVRPDQDLADLRVGQQLYLELVVSEADQVLRLPREYVVRRDGKTFAAVWNAGKVDLREIRVAAGDLVFDRVLAGIGPTDTVVRLPGSPMAANTLIKVSHDSAGLGQ
jgi:macrolide-specific efflux system membrane fusion protein